MGLIKLKDILRRDLVDRGRQWLHRRFPELAEDSTYFPELYHHGIKGQKWGVKNGPPYPLKGNKGVANSHGNSKIVEEAIRSGEVSKTINKEKQKRHTKTDHIPGRSYLDGDLDFAQELVDKYGGKGEAIIDEKGRWTHKEKFDASEIIGTHVSMDGTKNRTNKGTISYSRTGTHVYPRKEKK